MLTTVVANETGTSLILKEGTAGIKRILVVLPDKKTHKISVDSNATYREYWCAEKHDDPNAVVLSSDDCQEFKEVTIKRKVDTVTQKEVYYWVGMRRDNGELVTVVNGVKSDPVSGDTSKPGILKKIFGFFKPAAHDEQDSLPQTNQR